tara:strand:- start:161 stop:460 length:300 start_codon:yes stop_codon:yes gene_type:complete
MHTVDYDFEPGDNVFVVLDDTRVEAASVLSLKFKIYDDDQDVMQTVITYNVILDDAGEGTASVDSTNIFATLEEATDSIQEFLTPTPTITPTVTPSPSA